MHPACKDSHVTSQHNPPQSPRLLDHRKQLPLGNWQLPACLSRQPCCSRCLGRWRCPPHCNIKAHISLYHSFQPSKVSPQSKPPFLPSFDFSSLREMQQSHNIAPTQPVPHNHLTFCDMTARATPSLQDNGDPCLENQLKIFPQSICDFTFSVISAFSSEHLHCDLLPRLPLPLPFSLLAVTSTSPHVYFCKLNHTDTFLFSATTIEDFWLLFLLSLPSADILTSHFLLAKKTEISYQVVHSAKHYSMLYLTKQMDACNYVLWDVKAHPVTIFVGTLPPHYLLFKTSLCKKRFGNGAVDYIRE